ncbi:MAG: ABC transporter ATP-binding protein [Clostridiales bacterium]|nr:ABC transporter ATP-binding protein [Clostridiales bacterium]
MLEFHEVSFKYQLDTTYMLDHLSFQVKRGEFVCIIGASGCGKSTIFRLINGLETPENGEISVNGSSVSGQKNYSAFMPQKDLLFPWRSIEKNLTLPMEIQKVPKAERKKRCEEMLKEVGLLDYRYKYPKDLSGGMKQRISFARTLLTGSDLLLLDEPFSALDSLTRMDMQEWLLQQWEHFHKTILFITHDVEEAILLSKYIFVIQEKPITKMEKIMVPFQYPRSRQMLKNPEIVALKEELIGKLRRRKEDEGLET